MFDDMNDTLPAGYGEHAMERQETNNPLAFPGNITNADRVSMRIPPDASGGLVQHTSPYGGPGTTYGAPITFADPNNAAYQYTVDVATGMVRIDKAPGNRGVGTLLRASNPVAYDAIMSLAKAKVQTGGGSGWQQAAEAGASFLNAYTAQRYGQQGVAAAAATPAVDPNAQPASLAPPSTGVPWWVWAAGATVIGLIVWQATKGGSSDAEDDG